MHDNRVITEERIARAMRDLIAPHVYGDRAPLRVELHEVEDEPIPVAEALAADYRAARVGDSWGRPWGTSWFRFSGVVPTEWDGANVEALVDLGFTMEIPGFQAEGLAYTSRGVPIKGVAPRSTWVPITTVAGEAVLFLVEAASNPDVAGGFTFDPTPLGDKATAGNAPLYQLRTAELARVERPVWELLQDAHALFGLMSELDVTDPRRHEIVRSLDRMVDVLDPDNVAASAVAARKELEAALTKPATSSAHSVIAVGHAHIDSAWLWPVRETIRKAARTFSNVIALMDAEPDFVFACSQAQQLAWIKQHYPEVFARIREKVKAGQFVPVGGMWVESDTNMPGGEAMARQFLTGKRFYSEEFGMEPREVWLPDTFGYSGALPQIVRAAGSRWFLTQKISWNQTNRMPHHTFMWEGIDGTRVFTHFPPVDTYSSELSAAQLAHASQNYAEHGYGSTSLVPFGWGDGGGGPTREMIAAARRTADLEGSPRVRLGSPPQFFEAAEAEIPHPAVWRGEMYLETHRGTYTSQARTKRGNRRSEHALREAELWCTLASIRCGEAYPYDQLDELWKGVLLNQFHDILPGSAIAWVHREAEASYAGILADLERITRRAQQTLAGSGEKSVTFNAGPYDRRGIPALGASRREETPAASVVEEHAQIVLENDVLRVCMDKNGLIRSVLDKTASRELVPPGGAGNLLQLHRDQPNKWDAWDIDEHYRNVTTDLTEVESIDVIDSAVRVRRVFGHSSVEQMIRLGGGSGHPARQILVETRVDWHERQKLLKAAFELDIHADQFASETQFGHVYRPTHVNTSWEAARFEVCAHRWIHVGEPGYGAAIANDSTYGHDVTRITRVDGGTTTIARLSLLRSARFPDPDADQGEHLLRYALVAGVDIAGAVRAGYDLNLPLREVHGARDVAPLCTVDNPAVVVEAVKLAEDRSGDVIVRLYEAHGGRAGARVVPSFDVEAVTQVDLLEREVTATALTGVDASGLSLALRPFQIVTLRLARKR